MKLREEVTVWLSTQISLSRYDRKFMNSIYKKVISENRPISIKQNDLWEKIVSKYQKQIESQHLTVQHLLSFKWQLPPQEFKSKYPGSQAWIEEGELRVTFKFKEELINELREIRNRYEFDFVWDPECQYWHGQVTNELLTTIVNWTLAKIPEMTYDNSITNVIDQVEHTGNKRSWMPYVRTTTSGPVLLSASPTLHQTVDISNMGMTTVDSLSRCGVAIDPRLKRKLRQQNGIDLTDLATNRVIRLPSTDKASALITQYLSSVYSGNVLILDDKEEKNRRLEQLTETLIENFEDRIYKLSDCVESKKMNEDYLISILGSRDLKFTNRIPSNIETVIIAGEHTWGIKEDLKNMAQKVIIYMNPAHIVRSKLK